MVDNLYYQNHSWLTTWMMEYTYFSPLENPGLSANNAGLSIKKLSMRKLIILDFQKQKTWIIEILFENPGKSVSFPSWYIVDIGNCISSSNKVAQGWRYKTRQLMIGRKIMRKVIWHKHSLRKTILVRRNKVWMTNKINWKTWQKVTFCDDYVGSRFFSKVLKVVLFPRRWIIVNTFFEIKYKLELVGKNTLQSNLQFNLDVW